MSDAVDSSRVRGLPLIPNPPGLRDDGRPDERFVWRKYWKASIDHEERFTVQRVAQLRDAVAALIVEELLPLSMDSRYEVGRCRREGVPEECGPIRVVFHECQSRFVIIDVAVEANMDALVVRERVTVLRATRRAAKKVDMTALSLLGRLSVAVMCCFGLLMTESFDWIKFKKHLITLYGVMLQNVTLQNPDLALALTYVSVRVLTLAVFWHLWFNFPAWLRGEADFPSLRDAFSDRVRQAIYSALDRVGVHQGMVTHTPKEQA